ncbi:MAG: pyridoxamine 5'-phosphate oxidase family protein [Candidatus Moraniibacteriota bacterium]
MSWKDYFKESCEIVLATSSKDGIPNANIVISLGLIGGKLLVSNCQMNKTMKNLQENNKLCIIGGHFRIKGVVEIFSSGEYLELCMQKSNGYKVKSAILVTINEIFDLDKLAEILP